MPLIKLTIFSLIELKLTYFLESALDSVSSTYCTPDSENFLTAALKLSANKMLLSNNYTGTTGTDTKNDAGLVQLDGVAIFEIFQRLAQLTSIPRNIKRQNVRFGEVPGHFSPQLSDSSMMEEARIHQLSGQMMSLVQCVVQRIKIRTCYSLFHIQLTLFAAVLVLLIYRSEGVIKVHTRNTDGVHESCVIMN